MGSAVAQFNEIPGRGQMSMSTLTTFRPKLPALGLAALLGAGLASARPGGPVVHATTSTTPTAVSPVPSVAPRSEAASSYADLVSRVSPSVVTIRAERTVRPTRQEGLPDELRRFFGEGLGPEGLPGPHREGGLGSGVVVSADGYVLTNHHVVDGAERIQVELADRRSFSAKRVGSDPASDLAVLKIDATSLTPLPFGDSRAIRVGDIVLAFGNPLGIGPTVTQGIISAKGRSTGGSGQESFEDFLQTDAPINRGNSGGALVNLRGELVGINSQILSPSGGSIGIGFAIPSAMADNVMDQLIHGGKVRRGRLGVTVQPVNSEIARSLGMKEVTGALVSAVNEDSAADKAGVKRGDVILALNGAPVTDGNSLRNEIAATKPGSTVKLTVRRGSSERTLSAELGELNEPASRASNDDSEGRGGKLGLVVRPLTREEAREPGARAGLLVDEVQPDAPAGAAGFQPGDIIQEVDGKPVADADALRSAVKAAGDRPALVLVSRKGENLYLPLSARG
jgi:serine protease Do